MSSAPDKDGNRYEVTAEVELQLTWLKMPSPDPRARVETIRQRAEEQQRAREEIVRQIEGHGYRIFQIVNDLNERYAMTRQQRAAREAGRLPSPGSWNWYDARFMIAECLGAPEPEWDEVTSSWWQNREHQVLNWVQSTADVKRIPVPDWKQAEPVAKMLASHERWKTAFPEDPGWNRIWYLTLPSRYRSRLGGEPAAGINYPSYIDLGIFLLGTTRFLTIIGGEPELADALMDKCFELSATYTEFFLSVEPDRWEALLGFGGDVACMLSPRLYQRYSLDWDARLFEYVQKMHVTPDDLPCNLHSCGPSLHLYSLWGKHPYQKNIATMQTRLLPGQVKKLRDNLPNTFLQLTFHPQHFDFAQAEPAEVKRVLWEAARDAGLRDVYFKVFAVAHQPQDLGRLEANLIAFYETLGEMELDEKITRADCHAGVA